MYYLSELFSLTLSLFCFFNCLIGVVQFGVELIFVFVGLNFISLLRCRLVSLLD